MRETKMGVSANIRIPETGELIGCYADAAGSCVDENTFTGF